MSSPRSVRFDDATVARLSAYASRHVGMSSSGAVARLVDEGLRMDAHPGICFREGPLGRRAGLAAGSDVWELIRAVKSAREDRQLSAAEVLDVVEDNTGVPAVLLQIALSYYGEYPDEIDQQIQLAEEAEERTAQALSHNERLLEG